MISWGIRYWLGRLYDTAQILGDGGKMFGHMQDTTAAPAADLGFQAHPLANGLDSSPCKRRPDTGAPCSFLRESKDNASCENCYWLGKGDVKYPDPSLLLQYKTSGHKPQRPLKACSFPGCYLKTRSKTGYCSIKNHNGIVAERIKAWARDHGGDKDVPDYWLHRPIDQTKSNRR